MKKQYQVRFVRIERTSQTEKLYKLEAERDRLIKECAEQWARQVGVPKEDFYTVSLPTQLWDLLESWDKEAARAACEFWLKFNKRDEELT